MFVLLSYSCSKMLDMWSLPLEFKPFNLNKLYCLNNPKTKISHPFNDWRVGSRIKCLSLDQKISWMWGTLVIAVSLSVIPGIQEDIPGPETSRTRTHQTREFCHWVKTYLVFRNTDYNKIDNNIYCNRNKFTRVLNEIWTPEHSFSKYIPKKIFL